MRVELCDCENTLLQEIQNKSITRKSLALTYAMALCSSERVNFGRVNMAIVERWSVSGLIYIKKQAWKLIETKRKENHVDRKV